MYLAVFDIDGVLYDGHSIFDIIKTQEKKGFIPKGTWKKIESLLKLYKFGKMDYTKTANEMLQTYTKSLKGKGFKETKLFIRDFFEVNNKKLFTYFPKILSKLEKTHDVYLLTTNLKATAEVLVEKLNLKGYLSSEEELDNGVYTGEMLKSLAGNKKVIGKLLAKYPFKKSLAVGDSVNDISMLEKVDYAFCLNPDKKLKEKAKEKKWKIVNEKSVKSELLSLLK